MTSYAPLKSFRDFIHENLTTKHYYQELLKSPSIKYHLILDLRAPNRTVDKAIDLLNTFLSHLNRTLLRSRYSPHQYIRGMVIKESTYANNIRFHILFSDAKDILPDFNRFDRMISRLVRKSNRDAVSKVQINRHNLEYCYLKNKDGETDNTSIAGYGLDKLKHRQINNDLLHLNHDGVKLND
ncbi:MAG: hypothetical protein MH219_20400 [Marinobacter sp.]|jgi:hypothetical protein|nr:hypothetical protein [Marinobacter sp.]MCL1481503.1 hypothetical protein [Marinobacter sp.]